LYWNVSTEHLDKRGVVTAGDTNSCMQYISTSEAFQSHGFISYMSSEQITWVKKHVYMSKGR